ncbi:MAG: PAS domain S-box protein [Rhodocyclaceae bacterium]|nr:PAS domain S-box protein [Rhodocyclaceae bacterium]MBX3668993.1 PAS domain S-box protein [Rhodocyclaceae bacterium]
MNRIFEHRRVALAYFAAGALWLFAGDLLTEQAAALRPLPAAVWLIATTWLLCWTTRAQSTPAPQSQTAATGEYVPQVQAATELDLMRYANIVETSSDVLVYVDTDLRYRLVNAAACQLLGDSRENLAGREIRSVLDAHIYAAVEPALRRALGGEDVRFLSERTYRDGRHFVYDVAYRPFMPHGRVLGLVICMHDITHRVAAERSLASTQLALARAQEMALIATWVFDLRAGMSKLSAATMRLLDWPSEQISFADLEQLVHPDDRALVKDSIDKARQSGVLDFEHRLVINGRLKWVHVTGDLGRDADGEPLNIVGLAQDITAIRAAQLDLEAYRDNLEHLVAARTAELEAAQTRVRLILNSTADGVFGLDAASRISFVNPAACEALAQTPEQLIGAPSTCITQRAAAEGEAAEGEPDPFLPTLRDGETLRHEREIFWRSDGQPVTVAYACRPMLQNQKIVGAVVSFSDTSERLSAESARDRALREAERLAQVRSEFLANMSHEIRTPLNAVLGLAQIGRAASLGRKVQATFDGILDAGQLLLGIVNDILDYSKIEAGKLQLELSRVELGQVIDRAVQLVAPSAFAKGLAFTVDEAPGLPRHFQGDGLRLSQVLVNLLANAVKFSERGAVRLYARREADTLVLGVEDTGIGISKEQAARLFAPFEQADGTTTRRFGGTGLGLAICKRLVGLMRGDINVSSQLGAGSRFELRLPLAGVEAWPAVAPPCRVSLAGLAPAEASGLVSGLAAYGIIATVCAPIDIATDTAGLIVLAREALTPLVLANAKDALLQGRRIAVAAAPAQLDPLAGLQPGANLLQRPLRVRHALTLLSTPAEAPAPAPQAHNRLAGLNILAAEDNEINRLVLQDLLESEGAKLVCHDNGKLAEQALLGAAPGSFQLLITDIQMPEMDGYELARRARQIDPRLPVIGLTAHAMEEERERCLAAGMAAHLTKPVDLEVLVATVRQHAVRRAGIAAHAPGANGRFDAADAQQAMPGGASTAPVETFDYVALCERYHGKSEFVRTLLRRFVESQTATPGRLRQAAAEQALADIASMAHSLKGMTGALMAASAQTLAARADVAARRHQPDAPACAEQLASALETLIAGISSHLDGD